jgi:hypothetical protein
VQVLQFWAIFDRLSYVIVLGVRCGRALLQSTVVVDLLVVQVLEGEPVTEGQLQHLKFVDERKSQC